MKFIKTFEMHAYSKTKLSFFKGDVYVVFDDNEGRRDRNTKNWKDGWIDDKQKVLEMLKKHFDIEDYLEEHAMKNNAWAWIIRFFDSFEKPGIQLDIITTPGWHIGDDRFIITGEEFLNVGLENLESYFSAKKYNV